jgi:hypothetical protein
MTDNDLKTLWQASAEKIDTLLIINKQQLNAIQTGKADGFVRAFMRNHIAVMLLGLAWIALLIFLAWHGRQQPFFAGSLTIIAMFNVFAVALYLKHIIVLNEIAESDSIKERQEKLVSVYRSYSQSGRVLLLQAPFYCTFWYTRELWESAGPLFWAIQFAIVSAFTGAAIYLYRKLSAESTDGRWRNRADRYFGAAKLKKAIEVLRQVDES